MWQASKTLDYLEMRLIASGKEFLVIAFEAEQPELSMAEATPSKGHCY